MNSRFRLKPTNFAILFHKKNFIKVLASGVGVRSLLLANFLLKFGQSLGQFGENLCKI